MVTVDLQVIYGTQKSLDELVSRLNSVKTVERDCVLHSGIVSIKGDDIVHAHTGKFLQSDRAVQGFTGGSLGLKTLIQIGHNDCDTACLSAYCSYYALEVGKMIIRRHVIVKSEHAVSLVVIDYIHKDVEIHAAYGFVYDTFTLTGTETRFLGIDDVSRTKIACKGRTVLMFVLTFCAPVLEICIDFFSHCLTSGDCNQTELTKRGVVKTAFVVFFGVFHQG